ncbi:MAG TPA: HD domain-containing protein [Phycisphaerae bacterium]|nr:HD domain-containing protein [Phycisphaerae bacterium]
MDAPRHAAKPLHKVIRDPVHNLITLTGAEGRLILDLIGCPEFQRLRRIRQLGLGFLTYPGGEHSRWAHSLGVCHLAGRMLDSLLKQYRKGSKEHRALAGLRLEIIAAALLHDVGHGPFSHVFERAIPIPKKPPRNYPKDHEGWSEKIIRERFARVLRKHKVRVDVVTGLIDKADPRHLLAKDFISSQLDADRMDFLLRDSQATGPKYGEFDVEWLLHAMRIGSVKMKGQTKPVLRLCFDGDKAVHVVEEYIQAREFMYVQVYTHKTTRAYEAMLKNILGLASLIADGNTRRVPQPCPPALAKMLARKSAETDDYLSLDDFRLWCTFLDWAQLKPRRDKRFARLSALCDRLVHRRRPYRVIEIDVRHDEGRKQLKRAIELQKDIENSIEHYSLNLDSFEDLAYRNLFYRKSSDTEEQEDRVIQLIDARGKTHPAESLSDVIRAISGIETRVHRLYYDETDRKIVDRLRNDGWIKRKMGSRNRRKERAR